MRVSTPLAFSLAAVVAQVAALTINSPPSLIQCQPAAITWSEGPGGDVFLSVIEGGNAASANLVSFPTQNGASGTYTWVVNLDPGTSVTLKGVDSTGQPAYSSQVTIQEGSDKSCMNGDGGSSSSGAADASGSPSSLSSSSPSQSGSESPSPTSTVSSRAEAGSSSGSATVSGARSEVSSRVSAAISGASSVGSQITSGLGVATSAVGGAAQGVADAVGGNGAADRRTQLSAATAGIVGLAVGVAALMA